MAHQTWPDKSPRHGFKYDRVPTRRGSIRGGSVIVHHHDVYGPILDCLFEMADDVMTSNGISATDAIDNVLKSEHWVVLPTHRREIIARLQA